MKHKIKGKKLDRNRSSRKALVQSMSNAFFKHGEIETTLTKAKYIRPIVEKFITRARENNLSNRRILISRLQNEEIVEKLLTKIGPQFKKRSGGYTRIRKLGFRKGDGTQMAVFSLVEDKKPEPKVEKKTKKDENNSD